MHLLKITFLLTCLTLLLFTLGSAIGGQSGLLIAYTLACGMNFVSHPWANGLVGGFAWEDVA
jgi:heat shock protein HtpX